MHSPAAGKRAGSLGELVNDFHQFVIHFGVVGTAAWRAAAALQVFPQNRLGNAAQRRLQTGQLLEDFHTGPALLNHLDHAADLALDPAQPDQRVLLDLVRIKRQCLFYHQRSSHTCTPYQYMIVCQQGKALEARNIASRPRPGLLNSPLGSMTISRSTRWAPPSPVPAATRGQFATSEACRPSVLRARWNRTPGRA